MKKIVVLLVVLSTFVIPVEANIETTNSEDYIPSESSIYTQEELENLIKEQDDRMASAHQMAEAARALGYEEDHPVIILAKEEWFSSLNARMLYKTLLKEQKEYWDKRKKEYETATTIWLCLKEENFNDYVCAGILGNIMAEVGGNSLDLRYWLIDSTNTYYGMCQWNMEYYPVAGLNLSDQIDYLIDSIKIQIDNFGFCYKKDFDYEEFLSLTNEEEAALAFAKCYERCSSRYYNIRKTNAKEALKYYS